LSLRLARVTNNHFSVVAGNTVGCEIDRPACSVRSTATVHCQLNWAILLCYVLPEGKTE